MIWRASPGAHGEAGVEAPSGMASGIARTSVTFISEVPQPELVPALAHARLVLGGGPHGGREALVAPLRPPRELPRARAVEEHAVPQAGAELAHVAGFHWRRALCGRADDPRAHHEADFPRAH